MNGKHSAFTWRPRLCAVFINTEHAQVRRKVYRYSDGLRPLQDGSYEIMYNGTKTGKNDEHLLEAIENHYPFKIYMRKKVIHSNMLVLLMLHLQTSRGRSAFGYPFGHTKSSQ